MNEPMRERWIMTKAADDHVILPDDSIEFPFSLPAVCSSFTGRPLPAVVMATNLACNVPEAVGKPAKEFNTTGNQVWTGRMMKCRGGKIIREPAV